MFALKRWLLGTHHGAVRPKQLQAYLEEFTFRYNRRKSRHVGKIFYRMIEGSVRARPRSYKSITDPQSLQDSNPNILGVPE